MNHDEQITQAEFADLVGLTPGRVSQLHSDGTLPAGGTLREWLRAYCGRLREVAGRRADTPELAAERALLVQAKRKQEQLRLAELEGELIRVDVVRDRLARLLSVTRSQLLGLPARLALVVAPEADPRRVHDLLEAGVVTALKQLVDGDVVGEDGQQ